jgi:hypothetical protein
LLNLCFPWFSLQVSSKYGFWLVAIDFGNLKWIIVSFQMTTFFFKSLALTLSKGRPPPLARWPWIVMVFARKLHASFSNCFSFMFERYPNVDYSINVGRRIDTYPLLSKILQFSHSTRTVSHMWKIRSKIRRILVHSLVDLMLNIGFKISLYCYMVKHKKIKSKKFPNQSLALKWLIEKGKKLPCIFHCDVKPSDLVHRPIIW